MVNIYLYVSSVFTEFILVRLWRKLIPYRNTLESVPGTKQYWAMSVKFLAEGNNGLPLTGFEPMRLAILRLLVWCVNHSTTPPLVRIIEYSPRSKRMQLLRPMRHNYTVYLVEKKRGKNSLPLAPSNDRSICDEHSELWLKCSQSNTGVIIII